MPLPRLLLPVAIVTLVTALPVNAASPKEVFETRLMPIFRSPNPSSCVQCHLADVNIKDYILPDHEKTFRSLRDQGLIDLDHPEKSKILKLIAMGEDQPAGKAAVTAKTRKAEREAFAAWIQACATDATLRASPKLPESERARPAKPDAVIRHERKDRLLESFERNIWAMRFRCMNCHTEGTPQNDKYRQEHGERVAWFKKAGAEATMEYLLDSRLIDIVNPEKSLLLKKPLAEVKHGGGIKFVPGDLGYKAYRSWLEEVAAIRGGKYRKVEDLPPRETRPLQFGTDIWLRMNNTPPEWGDRLTLVELFAWDSKANQWEKAPIAITDRVVWGKGKQWQHNLLLLAEKGSDRAQTWTNQATLPQGRYLMRVYVDGKDEIKGDWKKAFTPGEYVGQVEVRSPWRAGNNGTTVVEASKVKKE